MVQAVDADEGKNGKLIYRIIDQREEISRRFSVDSFSGIISLQSDQDMTGRDKEYQFKVRYVHQSLQTIFFIRLF